MKNEEKIEEPEVKNLPEEKPTEEPKTEPFDYKSAYEALVSRLDKLENKTPQTVKAVVHEEQEEVEDFDTYCYNHFDKKKRG